MSNDFLTSLSLRAIQNTGIDSDIAALKPRVASRFEPTVLPAGLGLDENIQVEVSGVLEAKQQPMNKSAIAEENRSGVHRNPPLEREQPFKRSLISSQASEAVAKSYPGAMEPPAVPEHVEPIRMDHHLETPLVVKLVPSQTLHQEEKESSGSVPLLSSPIVPTHSGLGWAMETPDSNDSLNGLPSYPTSMEPKTSLSRGTGSLDPDAYQPKVVPERIKITYGQSPLLRSVIQQQLVPAIPRVEKKSQQKIREIEPAPTINVTIGRIEVKATSSTPSTKRHTPAPRVMNLDDYLRKRRGGER